MCRLPMSQRSLASLRKRSHGWQMAPKLCVPPPKSASWAPWTSWATAQVSQHAASGQADTVGLAMPSNISSAGRRIQFESIATAAADHQYALTLVQINKNELSLAKASRRMESLPVDGQILGLGMEPYDFETFVPPSSIPTVLISQRAHPLCATVSNDQVGCSADIVNYLMNRSVSGFHL